MHGRRTHFRCAMRTTFVFKKVAWIGLALIWLGVWTRVVDAQTVLTVTPSRCVYKISDQADAVSAGWAKPGFDDSGWASSLPSPEATLPIGPYQWTRCRLDLRPLAKTGQPFVQIEEFSAWQAFVDGVQAGAFGNLETGRYWMDLVRRFPIPQASADRGVVLIALRETRRALPALRYSAVVPPISAGAEQTLINQTKLASMAGFTGRIIQFGCYGFIGAAGVCLLILSRVDRSRRELFWLCIMCLGTGELRANEVAQVFLTHYPHWVEMTLFWIGQWLYLPYACFFFSLTNRKLPKTYIVLAAITPLWMIPTHLSFFVGPRMDQVWWWYAYYRPLSRTLFGFAGIAAVTAPIAAFWPVWRVPLKYRATFWVGMLWASGEGVNAAMRLSWFSWVDPTAFVREYRALVTVPAVLGMFFLLARQQRRVTEERSELRAEMRAAQEMQRLLVPRSLDLEPWIQIDVAYMPAKEVGGDFYFCRRVGTGQMVVIGDVSGKGLKAAMMASNVVGALRNEEATDPSEVLERLNTVVVQARSGGFVTCLCARFEADGRMRFANAGHIAPYVDGAELQAENALPLGLMPGATYTETAIRLDGRLVTLLSDGVLEAKDAQGELLGFERMAALTEKPAAEIAGAAKRWGQDDDITVLTVRCAAAAFGT